MAKQQFNPRRVLALISSNLLAEFFRRRNELTEVPWSTRAENDMQPLYDAWDALPEAQRAQAQVVLQDVNEMSGERGLVAMAEEIKRCDPDRMREFVDIESCIDKAMWVYLHLPEEFNDAVLFTRADTASTGRYWVKRNGLPREQFIFSEETKRNLARALQGFYGPTQGRGHCCQVEHVRRSNGADYFFAYLDDYPDNRMVFDAGHIRKQSLRGAFDNVFVFDPRNGTLELFAMGGKIVQQSLQQLFCKAVLGIDADTAPAAKQIYNLEGFKDKHFPLPTDPADEIAEVRVQRLRLEHARHRRQRITLEADTRGHRNNIYEMIDQMLPDKHASLSELSVSRVAIRLSLANHRGRAKTLSFEVGFPNTCDLKSKPDDMREIGERCLKMWGVARD